MAEQIKHTGKKRGSSKRWLKKFFTQSGGAGFSGATIFGGIRENTKFSAARRAEDDADAAEAKRDAKVLLGMHPFPLNIPRSKK